MIHFDEYHHINTFYTFIFSIQSSSYLSEEQCLFNIIIKKISHDFSLTLNASLNQFSGIKLNILNNFSLNNNSVVMTQDQLDQLVKWTIVKILTAYQTDSLKLLDSSELFDNNNQDELDEWNLLKDSFQAQDIDYFDLNSDIDSVKVNNNKQIYHNVFVFMNQIWIKTTIMNAVILQKNLKLCLLNKTDCWYTEELSYLIKVDLWNDNKNVEEWCKILKTKFHDPSSCALFMLESLQYILNNVQQHKNSVDYI